MILFVVAIVFSCRKSAPDPILPPLSNSGSHTLGFFINNEVWVPYDRGTFEQHELPHPTLTEEGHLTISSTRIDEANNARNWFCLEIESGCNRPGIYPITNRSCKAPYQTYYYGDNKDRSEDIYYLDTLQPHFIEIQYLDTINKIIAGTFSFNAYSNKNKKLIKVRSGRFDLKYQE